MHRTHRHSSEARMSCGGSSCDLSLLRRLEAVSGPISVIEGDYGLDAGQIAQLTGLAKDIPVERGVYRDGYLFLLP